MTVKSCFAIPHQATENGEESQEDTSASVDETDTHSSDDRDNHQQTDNIEMQDRHQQQNYERLSRPVSEMDLQALEMLDPDSSSQEENSNDRLEAAVSLSTLSVGLRHSEDIILNTENTSRILSSPSRRVSAANMLVIMSSEGFSLTNEEGVVEREVDQHIMTMPPIILTHTQPELGSIDLDSSMESEESSRHLESFHSVVSENDPSTDQNITVITSLPPREEEGGEGVREEVPLSDSSSRPPGDGGGDNLSPSDSDTNGTSSSRTRSRLRERDESTPRSIATGTL